MNNVLMIGGPKETTCSSKVYPGFAHYTITKNGKLAGIHELQTLTISAYSQTDKAKSKTLCFKNVKGQVGVIYGTEMAVFAFISMNNLYIFAAKPDGSIERVTRKGPYNPISDSFDLTMEMERVNVSSAPGGFYVSLESSVDKPEGDDYVTEGSRINIMSVISVSNDFKRIDGVNIWHAIRDSKYRGFLTVREDSRTLIIARGTKETIYYPLKPFELSGTPVLKESMSSTEELYNLAS